MAQENLDAALEELGTTADAMPTFTLVVSDATDRQTAAQYIQDVCGQIGIQIEIDTIPSATFWSTLREGYRYDFAMAGSGPDVDMEDFLLANGPVIPLYFTRAGWMLADGFTGISRNMTGADLDYIFGDKT